VARAGAVASLNGLDRGGPGTVAPSEQAREGARKTASSKIFYD